MAEPSDPPSEYKKQNDARHRVLLQKIADEKQRAAVNAHIEEYYQAWRQALRKAFAQRFEDSPRIENRKIKDRRIDERLIRQQQKEDIRRDAIREAAAISHNRIDDINHALPRLIETAIEDAVRLSGTAPIVRAAPFRRWAAVLISPRSISSKARFRG